MLQEVVAGVANWGPGALLTFILLLLTWTTFKGKLIPEGTHNKIVDKLEAINLEKDKRIAALELYYEGRITDINTAHAERGADLRHVAETNARALQTAVDNTQKLVGIVDELTEIARVTAPAILAARNAAEATNRE